MGRDVLGRITCVISEGVLVLWDDLFHFLTTFISTVDLVDRKIQRFV